MILNGRSRKSKCDGSLPCSSCTLRGTSDTCSFPHPTRSEVPSRRLEGALKRRRDDQDISTPRDDRLDSVRLHLGRALLSIGETVGATLTISHHHYVRFDEVKDLFPSVETCLDIFEYFQTEIFWHCTYIHRPTLLSNWRRFAINGVSLPRLQVSLFCMTIAMSLLQMPDAKIQSFFSSIGSSASLDHRFYVRLANAIQADRSGPFQTADVHDDDTLFLAGMMVNYFVATGSLESTWEALGKALRMARMVDLFNPSRRSEGTTDLSRELRTRLAWELIYQDAFCCMHFTKKSEIEDDLSLSSPNFYLDDSYDIYSGALIDSKPKRNEILADFHHGRRQLYEGIKRSSRFIRLYEQRPPNWLFQEAWYIDEEMDDAETIRFPSSLRMLTLQGTSREDYVRCHLSVLGVMGSRRIRSSVLRMLLLNGSGDVLVEETALSHARKIIELVPTLDQLANSPYVAYFSPFCSSMIFHAACTFALSFLLQSSKTTKIKSNEHFQWLQDNIIIVLNSLEKASKRDIMALRCRQLLIAICGQHDQLKKCFNGKLMNHLTSGKKSIQDGMLPLDIYQVISESNKATSVPPAPTAGNDEDAVMSAEDWTSLLAMMEADLDQTMIGGKEVLSF